MRMRFDSNVDDWAPLCVCVVICLLSAPHVLLGFLYHFYPLSLSLSLSLADTSFGGLKKRKVDPFDLSLSQKHKKNGCFC